MTWALAQSKKTGNMVYVALDNYGDMVSEGGLFGIRGYKYPPSNRSTAGWYFDRDDLKIIKEVD